MKKTFYIICFVIFLNTTNAQNFNPALAKMLQDSLNYYTSVITNIKGISASVFVPGQGIWQGSAGVSYAGKPITNDMTFGIASNTKLFVATIILKLAENNLLTLNDTIDKWLSPPPNINPKITIRQLLNHRSGVSDPLFVAPYMDTIYKNPNRIFTPNEVLNWVGSPNFNPGASYSYSNINYILAGMVAENITGFHISKLIRDSILIPLNLDSTFYDTKEMPVGTIAHRWWNNTDYNDTSRVGLNTAGGCAGAMFSNSSEMARWYHALFSGQLLTKNSIAELTNFVPTTSSIYQYGLGLSRETTLGKTYWGHAGSTWGYKSKMIYDSSMQVVVCGLTNSFPAGMDGLTFILYRILFNNLPLPANAINGANTVCQGANNIIYTSVPIANATSYQWTLPNGVIGSSNSNTITVSFNSNAQSGKITVSGVNQFGTGLATEIMVSVKPTPPKPSILKNGNTLTSSAIIGNQWYNQKGIINGATNQSFLVTENGKYYCIVSNLGCISPTSDTIDILLINVSKLNQNSNFNIYPNPTTGAINLSSYYDIAITDLSGREIIEYKNVNSFNISKESKGIYILYIKEDGCNAIFKTKILKY